MPVPEALYAGPAAARLCGGSAKSDFHDYPVLASTACRALEGVIADGAAAPRGTGEVSVPPIMPAAANAVFAATGVRLRHSPFTPARFRAAREAMVQ